MLQLVSIFTNITSHLDGNDTTGTPDPTAVSTLSGQDLTDITDAINNVLKTRSEVGAKSNRMDSALSKNTDENSSMTDLLSKTEDIDITEKTMEYATMQTVYMASLQTSAKVIQPTLMDYLR
jgi:flagellar hook-associated protein 3 FlgL